MGPQGGANGVLPVSVLQKNAPANAPRGPKAQQPRLKLVLRRLPPGLTKPEFETSLGDEWKLGAGKVDWLLYKKGKVSKDAAKPSRPSIAYLKVTSESHVAPFGDYVRRTSFNDAAKSFQDGALVGPPTLAYAPYHRLPGGRKKNDPRQGTIDQDQEFKDFLESLTNPITKAPAPEADGQKEAKVTSTPLIDALREKKASKDKPQPKTTKHGRGEAKDDAAEKTDKKILTKGAKDAPASVGDKGRRPTKAERAAKEAVKVLNKEASARESAASSAAEKSTPASPAPSAERKRGGTANIKSMLQRDLGLGPAPTRRRGTKREVGSASTPSTPAQSEPASTPKTKTKEPPVAPAAATPAPEKPSPAPPKKTSRAERRAFKATSTLVDKTNSKNGEEQKAQTKAAAMPAPTILKKPQAPQTPSAPKGPAASRAPPTEPAAARVHAQPQAKNERPSTPRSQQPAQTPATSSAAAASGRQAFLKHANPSQGITEPLIEEALKVFGAIEKVEIDKRKGFAYVDFADAESLRKAISASPVKVAQGAVQVLERKEKVVRNRVHPGPHGPPTGPARGGRGGGFAARGGRGGRGPRGAGHAGPNAAGGESSAPAPAAAPAAANVAT